MKAIHFATHSAAPWPDCAVTKDREDRHVTFDLKEVTCKGCLRHSLRWGNSVIWNLPLAERDRLEEEISKVVKLLQNK